MTEQQVERIAIALEKIAELMENSEKREVNLKRNEIKEAKKATKNQKPNPLKESK